MIVYTGGELKLLYIKVRALVSCNINKKRIKVYNHISAIRWTTECMYMTLFKVMSEKEHSLLTQSI